MKQLNENETLRYRVMYNGKTLYESASMHIVENFISTLDSDVQESVLIVPVTTEGLQVLLG